MIKSFGDRRTQVLFDDKFVRDFQGIARGAKRKLDLINAATRVEELRVPPGNRLELLRGNFEGHDSIRVNNQWRVEFRWIDGDDYDVRIVDYH